MGCTHTNHIEDNIETSKVEYNLGCITYKKESIVTYKKEDNTISYEKDKEKTKRETYKAHIRFG